MTGYLPPGWPAGVHPPGSEEFEQTAVNWLLEVVPPDYRLHGVLMRHPVALAALARQHVHACVQGARDGYRTARADLGGQLPPQVIEAVLGVYRGEGTRLAAAAQGVDLIERALRGEVFVPQLGGRQDASRRVTSGQAERERAERSRPERAERPERSRPERAERPQPQRPAERPRRAEQRPRQVPQAASPGQVAPGPAAQPP
jgi:hypothetical protein